LALVTKPFKHRRSKRMTARATVDSSIFRAMHPRMADFFKLRILESVRDGGNCG
jgi:hypothetical protein